MLPNVLLFALGLVLLIKGGDWFVDGATGLARRFKIPELLIGATVVSIGTTLPEVMVSATSAAQGIGGIAYGNAIGSIICNTSLIAAITIAVKPAKIEKKSLTVPVAFFFGAAAFYCTVAYAFGRFSRLSGVILLLGFAAYMTLCVLQALKNQNGDALEIADAELDKPVEDAVSAAADKKQLIKDIIFLVIGAALIAVGADLLVDNGTIIAEELGVPAAVIGLTFVALGTSLPELVTAITSLVKGHGALSLGNVIGANLFNLVLVSGVSTVIGPFDVPAETLVFGGTPLSFALDIPVMLGVMLILTVPAFLKGKLYRAQGIALLCVYAAFTVLQFVLA